jgi:hypothetical protein
MGSYQILASSSTANLPFPRMGTFHTDPIGGVGLEVEQQMPSEYDNQEDGNNMTTSSAAHQFRLNSEYSILQTIRREYGCEIEMSSSILFFKFN